MAQRQLPERFRTVSDADWFRMLAASVTQPVVGGLECPGFPPAALQERFVGQSGVDALRQAHVLYTFFKAQMQGLGQPLTRASRCLDFGCAWGLFLRFFWKDVDEANLFGCDASQPLIALCESLRAPGQLAVVDPHGRLPYPDAFFDGVLSPVAFAHLPEQVHLHWQAELARVCKPRAVVCLTLEPRRLLDHVGAIPTRTNSPRDRIRLAAKHDIAAHVAEYTDRGFTFLAPPPELVDIPGDAVCSPAFITRHWGSTFDLKTYIDHASQMPRAVVTLQRRA